MIIFSIYFLGLQSCLRQFFCPGEKGEPPSQDVHLPQLPRRYRFLQLLPRTGPDDASEPVARLRLLSLLSHKPIPKHFNIIEKNCENAMSWNVLLANCPVMALTWAILGQKRRKTRFLIHPWTRIAECCHGQGHFSLQIDNVLQMWRARSGLRKSTSSPPVSPAQNPAFGILVASIAPIPNAQSAVPFLTHCIV